MKLAFFGTWRSGSPAASAKTAQRIVGTLGLESACAMHERRYVLSKNPRVVFFAPSGSLVRYSGLTLDTHSSYRSRVALSLVAIRY